METYIEAMDKVIRSLTCGQNNTPSIKGEALGEVTL